MDPADTPRGSPEGNQFKPTLGTSQKLQESTNTIREYNFPVHTVPTHILSHFCALGPSGEMSLNFSAHQNKYSYTTKELIVHFCVP
jgi:hypothetical protein